MTNSILVASGKGGAGKSTVSAFLGEALASRGQSVLLVELDSGLRSLDVALGLSSDVVLDFGDVIRGSEPQEAILSCPFCPRLSVLCASGSTAEITMETLVQVLMAMDGKFDTVIWDCPAGIGEALSAAAKVSSMALVVATPDPSSVRAAYRAGLVLRSEKLENRRLIINRCPKDPKKLHPLKDLDEVIDQTELPLLGVLWDDPATRIAFNTGVSLPIDSPNFKPFSDLAGRILGEHIALGIQ